MIFLALTPILVGLLLRGFAGRLGMWLRPNLAVPLITALALTVALCTGLVLSAVAVLACAQLGPLAQLGKWSGSTLKTDRGFPAVVGVVALIVVLGCMSGAGVRATRSVRALLSSERAVRLLHPCDGDLVLVSDDTPIAYSVAAWHGRVVVSTSMLAALSGPERRVLLAHETAHLRHHHHLYLHAARLAAAANPLLRSAADVVTAAVERWADEDAAQQVGDRPLAARALARAALAGAGRPTVRHALGVVDGNVGARVQLLLAPAIPPRRAPVALILAAAVLSWTAAVTVAVWANHLVQLAESVYPHS